jgi:hypothetical protein
MTVVRRLALAAIVLVLAICASGTSGLFAADLCITGANARTHDTVCPTGCAACGCCAEAAEPVTPASTTFQDPGVSRLAASHPFLLRTDPRDILHVPKTRLS